jgi:hypothetical protein
MIILFTTYRGHSLTGKTAILHIVISGSSPDVSIYILFFFYNLIIGLLSIMFNIKKISSKNIAIKEAICTI